MIEIEGSFDLAFQMSYGGGYDGGDQWASNGAAEYTDTAGGGGGLGDQGETYQLQEQNYNQGYGAVEGGDGGESKAVCASRETDLNLFDWLGGVPYAGGGGTVEAGSLFRSEEMALCQLFLQVNQIKLPHYCDIANSFQSTHFLESIFS